MVIQLHGYHDHILHTGAAEGKTLTPLIQIKVVLSAKVCEFLVEAVGRGVNEQLNSPVQLVPITPDAHEPVIYPSLNTRDQVRVSARHHLLLVRLCDASPRRWRLCPTKTC